MDSHERKEYWQSAFSGPGIRKYLWGRTLPFPKYSIYMKGGGSFYCIQLWIVNCGFLSLWVKDQSTFCSSAPVDIWERGYFFFSDIIYFSKSWSKIMLLLVS